MKGLSQSVDVSPSVQISSVAVSPEGKQQAAIIPSKRGRPRQGAATKSGAAPSNNESPDLDSKALKRQRKDSECDNSFLSQKAIQKYKAQINAQQSLNDLVESIQRKNPTNKALAGDAGA